MSYLIKKNYYFSKYLNKDFKDVDGTEEAIEYDDKETAEKIAKKIPGDYLVVKKY